MKRNDEDNTRNMEKKLEATQATRSTQGQQPPKQRTIKKLVQNHARIQTIRHIFCLQCVVSAISTSHKSHMFATASLLCQAREAEGPRGSSDDPLVNVVGHVDRQRSQFLKKVRWSAALKAFVLRFVVCTWGHLCTDN